MSLACERVCAWRTWLIKVDSIIGIEFFFLFCFSCTANNIKLWEWCESQTGFEKVSGRKVEEASKAIGFKLLTSYPFTIWSQSCVLLMFVSCVAGTELPTLREWVDANWVAEGTSKSLTSYVLLVTNTWALSPFMSCEQKPNESLFSVGRCEKWRLEWYCSE